MKMGEKKMVSIFDVAKYFLTKDKASEEKTMTPLKLQKLCYYAQAWSMVWDDKELFKEDFQAWVHGPANYDLFKKYKEKGIGKDGIINTEETINIKSTFSHEEIETLDSVWEAYGRFTGTYLEQLTHQERPWKETRGTLPPGMGSDRVINKSLIKEYYQKEYGQ